jgi:hypothetical protein
MAENPEARPVGWGRKCTFSRPVPTHWLSRTQCYVSALDKAASAARSPLLKLSSVHR